MFASLDQDLSKVAQSPKSRPKLNCPINQIRKPLH